MYNFKTTNPYPHELQFGDVYLTPIMIVLVVAFFATLFSVIILNKLRLAKYILYPQYVFLAIMVFYTILIDTYWIHF